MVLGLVVYPVEDVSIGGTTPPDWCTGTGGGSPDCTDTGTDCIDIGGALNPWKWDGGPRDP